MSKIKLGIDIDEVLRAKWAAFDKCYDNEFGDEGITEPFNTYEFRNHYEFKDTEVVEQILDDKYLEADDKGEVKISPKQFIVDQETGKAPIDDFIMNKETKFLTGEEMFNKFLYEDYLFEIHASAPKLYTNADVDLNVFQKRYADYFEFVLFTKGRKETIPSTLFFLAKQRIECRTVLFVDTNEEIWDKVDWILTTDPTFEKRPESKKLIILDRPYNLEVKSDYNAYGVLTLNNEIKADEPNEFLEYIKNNIN